MYPKEKKSFFEKVSFLDQSDVKKEEIVETVIAESDGNNLYWIEIIISTLIAAFGLLQNSVAVIIGAMLIAPLIRPMQGMSFAMATGRSNFFWKAGLFLLKSVVLAIGISFLFAFLIPLKTETPEILARTAPNILDLFIAIFSAIIALLSLGYKRLSASVAGVAMAASLMPPLAVVGIELSLGNFLAAWGGFLLFFINFLAILLVGVVVFLMYGFTPHQEFQKKISSRKIFTLVIIIIFTSIPLYSSLSNISLTVKTEKQAQEFLSELIPVKIPSAFLKDISVLSVDDETIHFAGVLQVPENTQIFKTTYDSILTETQVFFEKSITFDFQMIRTANLTSPDKITQKKDEILSTLDLLQESEFPSFTLLQTIVDQKDIHEWNIQYILSIPQGEFLTLDQRSDFENLFAEKHLDITANFQWVGVAGSPKKNADTEKTQEEIIQKNIVQNITELLSRPEMENIFIENISVTVENDAIEFKARALFPQVKNTVSVEDTPVNISDSLFSLFSASSPKNTLEPLVSAIPETTPFSIEQEGTGPEIIESEIFTGEKNPEWIAQKVSENLATLPYKNITIYLQSVPYYNEIISVNKTEE